jgi:hypothetical protein
MKTPILPLPILNDQPPVLLIFDPADPAIELAYERTPLVGGARIRSATRDSDQYWIPRCTPVFAIAPGTVIYANNESDGHAILIDHGNDLLSSYSRLAHMYLMPADAAVPTDTMLDAGAPTPIADAVAPTPADATPIPRESLAECFGDIGPSDPSKLKVSRFIAAAQDLACAPSGVMRTLPTPRSDAPLTPCEV